MDKTVLMLVIAALLLGVLPAGILGYSWWVEAWVRLQDCDIVQDFKDIELSSGCRVIEKGAEVE